MPGPGGPTGSLRLYLIRRGPEGRPGKAQPGQYALVKKIFGRLTEAELRQMHALVGRLDSACSECD